MFTKLRLTIAKNHNERMKIIAAMSGLTLTSWARMKLIESMESSQYFVEADRAVKDRGL